MTRTGHWILGTAAFGAGCPALIHPGITASAAVGVAAGTAAMLGVKLLTGVLCQWYVLTGSLAMLGAGTLASAMAGRPARRNTPREG